MRVLIVKTSSLGDVLHTLPAVTEAAAAHPDIRFDWVVEPAFASVPRWHPAVARVIEAPLRGLRGGPLRSVPAGLASLAAELRVDGYDAVIDAQGLIKSALLARRARGRCFGLDPASIRERPAAYCYERWVKVPRGLHAVERTRRLFAAVLGHPLRGAARDHGIAERVRAARTDRSADAEVLFLPGTTWRSKHWPEAHWIDLAAQLVEAG
ncbi:MAG: lipopolysaccharide heptosyltransferase I, partial [Pseudomonadales bacterium]|nr:lipopolysaccharide heptosyltransferase I [Pseudomonadales bacterium]